jgi:hypothetical protein
LWENCLLCKLCSRGLALALFFGIGHLLQCAKAVFSDVITTVSNFLKTVGGHTFS